MDSYRVPYLAEYFLREIPKRSLLPLQLKGIVRWDRVDEVGKQMLAVVGKGEAGNKMLERRVFRDWDYGWRLCARWNQDLLTRVMKAAADIDMSGDHSKHKKSGGQLPEYLFHFLFFKKKNKLHVDTCVHVLTGDSPSAIRLSFRQSSVQYMYMYVALSFFPWRACKTPPSTYRYLST